jgi:hypothetical protein
MASAESDLDAARLQAGGWRTYRIRSVDRDGRPEALSRGEVACPGSVEGGKVTACAWCLLCDGSRAGDTRRSIAIVDHSGSTVSRVARLRRSRDGLPLAAGHALAL